MIKSACGLRRRSKKGIRNLEEILQRLDDRAQNRQWLKEHAPQPAPDNGETKKAGPLPVKAAGPESAPADIASVKPAETPAVIPPVTPITPAPIADMPVKAPEPAVKYIEPKINPEKIAPPVLGIRPASPVKKASALNKNALIFFCLGLAVAGGVVYQFAFNSAKARYAQAGRLVKTARNAEAISAYTRIAELYKSSPEAAYSQFAIGEIKAVQGNLTEAIKRYEKYLVAAPAGDAKVAEAKFRIAEIEFKQANFPDAEFMYQNADIRASAYAERAADRVKQIQAVKTQIAGARKLLAKDPAKAVEALAAVLAAYPGLKAAAAGLEDAQKALAAANARKADKAAGRARGPKTRRRGVF